MASKEMEDSANESVFSYSHIRKISLSFAKCFDFCNVHIIYFDFLSFCSFLFFLPTLPVSSPISLSTHQHVLSKYGALPWSMVDMPRVIALKETGFPSPGS